MGKTLTVAEAARRLGISERRVIALIHQGKLSAHRFGRAWAIAERNLKLVAERKPGAPTGNKNARRKKEANNE